MVAALEAGAPMGYTEAFGLRSLRERIARHYAERHGAAVPAERIAVTVGASGAFPLAFLAAFDAGDRVAMAAPYYPPYVNILTALGMVPQILPCDASTRWQPTSPMLEALDPRPAGLILASPCNPAGTMLPAAEFIAIARWCETHGVRLISDEIYHGLTYGTVEERTAAAHSTSAVVVNSFSKYFSMTGWRIGWLVLPEDLVRPVECLAQNMFINAPHVAQVAAEAAFACRPELEANIARYRRNRDVLLAGLPAAGLDRLSPADGAFYLWADVGHLTNDSPAFCRRLLAEAGIAATRASTSMPPGAAASSACPIAARRRTWPRCRGGWPVSSGADARPPAPAALRAQWAMRTGKVICRTKVRVTPPRTISRSREWP
ncbi:pyridoxal phosphate-dependent aminotransferase [Paeniroseomonas aquatica]